VTVRWEVTSCKLHNPEDTSFRRRPLSELLADGWEPFAVSPGGWAEYRGNAPTHPELWLRRLVDAPAPSA
jgi:hypothetical protein